MALKSELDRYPNNKGGQPPERVASLGLSLGIGTLGLLLAGCATSQTETIPTPSPAPTELTPTPQPSLTPTPERGATIPEVEVGETLAIGGLNWEIKKFNTDEIAQLLGEGFKGWTIIGGENNLLFNIASYDAEGYRLLLPHAPSNYQWDAKNQVWINSNTKEILFPHVALPGGWNEEKQAAGPTAIPDVVLMLRDPEGNIQVGVIYQNEVLQQAGINPQMNPENYHLLPDGRYLYLGPPKNLTLQQGQTIEAVHDENNQLRYHRITNPDGSWFMVLTSWNQVTNPQQVEHMFKLTGIQVGDETTSIPYPQDEIVNNLGIEEYGKLEDGTYVAYQIITNEETGEIKKLIVAQAIFETDDNGQLVFKEWQPTIPLENLAVPDPRITNPELFDLTNREAPIPQFANALKNAGIDLTSEQIAQNITYVATKADGTPLVDKDGNPFVVAVYNLDPSLFPPQYQDLAGPIPLFSAKRGENGWRWERSRPNNVFNLVNIPVGVYLEPGKNNDYINKIATENFDELVLPIFWHVMLENSNNINFSLPDSINTLANQNGKKTFGGALLWQNPDFLPDWVKTSPLTQKIINETIGLIIKHYPTTTAWIVVNEPYPGDFFASRFGYPNYIIEAFRATRQYTDKPLILNDFRIETPGQKYKNTKELVNILRNEGLIDGVGIQMHVNPQKPPSTNALIKNFRSWGVPVYITELDCPTEDEKLKAKIFADIIKAALESEVVIQINFWGLGSASWQEDATLFNNNNEPNLSYFKILNVVLDYLRE